MVEHELAGNVLDAPDRQERARAMLPLGGPLARGATRIRRTVRDAWDVVRWTRAPLEVARAMLPLPPRWMDMRVLNAGGDAGLHQDLPEATGLGAALAGLGRLLQSDALVRGRVSYAQLPGSETYTRLTVQSRALASVQPGCFTDDAQRIAFWLNVYNSLSIHGAVAMGIRRSVMELPSFFARVAYRVGDHVFSLDDVSNGVLRCAAPKPYTGRPQFHANDPRLAYCPRQVDPRIHGALVCAADSCPPVAFYRAEQLDAQLEAAAANFVNGSVHFDAERRELRLPLQFFYYARDFGGFAGVGPFILRYLDAASMGVARRAFHERWRIRWVPYDWALNLAR